MSEEQKVSSEVPLSSAAQEAKERVHQELMRSMANKMMAEAIEEERQRRIKENEAEDGGERQKAYSQLIVVQEDLVRTINLMRVSFTVVSDRDLIKAATTEANDSFMCVFRPSQSESACVRRE